MLKYEVLSILRNKMSCLFVLILLVFGLRATIDLENTIAAYQNSDTVRRDLQYELTYTKQVRKTETGSSRSGESIETRLYMSNVTKYRDWKIDFLQELIDILDEQGIESTEYLQKKKIYDLICAMASNQMLISTDYGCDPVEIRFQEEIEQLGSEIGWDVLPFDMAALVNNPFISADQSEAYAEGYENQMKALEQCWLDFHEKTLSFQDGSPYAFLALLFSENKEIPMILDICILIFAFGYVLESRTGNRYYAIAVLPGSSLKKYGHYAIALFFAICLLALVGIGSWFLYWGMKYGFGGMGGHMLVDLKTYTGLQAYEHLDHYSYLGIAKMYADYQGGSGKGIFWVTRYPLGFMPVYRFLMYMGILAVVKVFFLCFVGTGTALLFRNQQMAVGCAVVLTAAWGYSQMKGAGLPYNPLAVASCWDVTLGCAGVTWLRALLGLMLASCVIIMAFCVAEKYTDKA